MTNHKNPMTFIFPGQGSQALGMGKYLYDNFNLAKNLFEEASDAISLDLKKLCFESNEETLALTENTQPALLTVSVATAVVLEQNLGLTPQVTAGHSIGEYSSFVIGKVLTFSDAMRSVRQRGVEMQSAVPVGQGGMMATLGLTQSQVEFLCQWCEVNSGYKPVSPANYNCDGQIVISGNLKALHWLKDRFNPQIFIDNQLGEAKRAKLIPLQVSAPFHCQLMKPAEINMRKFFEKVQFNDSRLPIIQNFHANLEIEHSHLKENLIKQISAPVLWTQSMQTLKNKFSNHDSLTVIECGNGQVLKGLLKKIDAEYFKVYSTSQLDDLKAIESLLNA